MSCLVYTINMYWDGGGGVQGELKAFSLSPTWVTWTINTKKNLPLKHLSATFLASLLLCDIYNWCGCVSPMKLGYSCLLINILKEKDLRGRIQQFLPHFSNWTSVRYVLTYIYILSGFNFTPPFALIQYMFLSLIHTLMWSSDTSTYFYMQITIRCSIVNIIVC